MIETGDKSEKLNTSDFSESFFARISNLFPKIALREHEDEFRSELAYYNFSRLRILAVTVLILIFLLLARDAVHFLNGKWNESAGHPIIAAFHLVLIVFLGGVVAATWNRKPTAAAQVTSFHKMVTGVSIPFVMVCLTIISIGDVMAYGSTVAYLGTIFACAAIFLMTHRYGFLLFGLNMALMLFLLILVGIYLGLPIDLQVINVITFTVVAFILSRLLFFYSRKDFANRLLIREQSDEISRQNQEKEDLIQELRSALDEVKTLSGFLPICAACKKIRDDDGYWDQLESYLQKHSDARFSHGYCPDCAKKIFLELTGEELQEE